MTLRDTHNLGGGDPEIDTERGVGSTSRNSGHPVTRRDDQRKAYQSPLKLLRLGDELDTGAKSTAQSTVGAWLEVHHVEDLGRSLRWCMESIF